MPPDKTSLSYLEISVACIKLGGNSEYVNRELTTSSIFWRRKSLYIFRCRCVKYTNLSLRLRSNAVNESSKTSPKMRIRPSSLNMPKMQIGFHVSTRQNSWHKQTNCQEYRTSYFLVAIRTGKQGLDENHDLACLNLHTIFCPFRLSC